ncbi:MAG: energy transducer TonB [Verrucomicrobiales bacterium]
MTAADSDLVRWTRRDWIGVALLLLLAQFILLLVLSDKKGFPTVAPEVQTEFALGSANGTTDPLLDFELQTQLLFIQPNASGFSGAAWLHKKNRAYLSHSNRVSNDFLRFTQAQKLFSNNAWIALQTPSAHHKESRIIPFSAPPLLGGGSTLASRLEVEGFEGRLLRKPPTLNMQYHSDVLGSTVIQAGVDGDGFTRVARILQGSGSRAVDNEALAVARSARFTPVEGLDDNRENLAWGKLIFHWHTLELTNKTSAPR